MDFLKKFAETNISKEGKDETPAEKAPPAAAGEQSNSDLMADAKLVADAARSTFNKETPKYENSQVAGAAGDLLDAAQKYGKLDEAAGVGSYIEKAENYLHDYESKNTVKPRETAPPTEPKKEDEEAKPSEPEPAKPSEPEPAKKEEDAEPAKKEEEGDFAKIAEGGISKLAGGFKF